jgi:hypothetical protein
MEGDCLITPTTDAVMKCAAEVVIDRVNKQEDTQAVYMR